MLMDSVSDKLSGIILHAIPVVVKSAVATKQNSPKLSHFTSIHTLVISFTKRHSPIKPMCFEANLR